MNDFTNEKCPVCAGRGKFSIGSIGQQQQCSFCDGTGKRKCRTGDWIATFTGRKWFLSDPHPDDVDISDIGHALSMITRYGGHCSTFYSVAQHSVYTAEVIAELFPDNALLQLYTLVHDAPEAYLGDVVRPLKRSLPLYRDFEQRTMEVILAGLKIPKQSTLTPKEWLTVKQADDVLLMTERRDLIDHRDYNWSVHAQPWHRKIQPVNWAAAETLFLSKYNELRARIDGQA